MSSVYGPVLSWRLGRSLGIDVLLPPKTCTFDCVYCQLGPTVKKVSGPEDLEGYVKVKTVLHDLRAALETIPLRSLDYITFSGSGEPTLNPMLGKMIDALKSLTNGVPIAVLTNASLVSRKDVRMNLCEADLVVAKLDAPNQELFEAVNKPVKNIALSSIIKGLKLLREEMRGRLALQIMLFHSLQGASNEGSVEELAQAASMIKPDEVQLNTPTRPPSEKFVLPLGAEELERIAQKFREMLPTTHIVVRSSPRQSTPVEKCRVDEEEILEVLKRRPCRLIDLAKAFGVDESKVRPFIEKLIVSRKVIALKLGYDIYYEATRSGLSILE